MGATHNVKHRDHQAFPAAGAADIIHSVNRSAKMTEIQFCLNGNIVVSAGSASGTSQGPNPEQAALTRLKLNSVSNGLYPDGELVNVLPETLAMDQYFQYRAPFRDAALTGATGTFNIETTIRLPFAQRRFGAHGSYSCGYDTALDTDQYQSLQFILSCGSLAGQLPGNNRTVVYNTNWDIFDVREQLSGNPHAFVWRDFALAVPSVTSQLMYDAFKAGLRYTELTLIAESTANNTFVDTLLNRAIIEHNLTPRYDLFLRELRAYMRGTFVSGSDGGALNGGNLQGVYKFPLVPSLHPAAGIDVVSAQGQRLILDTNNPGGAGADRYVIASKAIVPNWKIFPKDSKGNSTAKPVVLY